MTEEHVVDGVWLVDGNGKTRTVEFAWTTYTRQDIPDGEPEGFNEDFRVDDELVSYADMVDLFGKSRVDLFIERAVEKA